MDDIAADLQNLSKRYGKSERFAFHDVDVRIPRNTITSLLGGNGSGKSSLLEVISGTRRPTSGNIAVFGKDPMLVRGKIGYLPQNFSLYDKLTVEENIRYFSSMYGRDIDIAGVMDLYGVSDFSKKRYDQLSGGMRRRTEIACILSADPDLIIMDEPSAGLDNDSSRELWELIEQLKDSGKTIIVASHEEKEAVEHSDIVLRMKDGILTEGGVI